MGVKKREVLRGGRERDIKKELMSLHYELHPFIVRRSVKKPS